MPPFSSTSMLKVMRIKHLISILIGFFLGVAFMRIVDNDWLFSFCPNKFPEATCQQRLSYDDVSFNDTISEKLLQFRQIEHSISSELRQDVKLLCWVMHSANRVDLRRAIIETWGRRCNHLLFVVGVKSSSPSSNQQDPPVVVELGENISLLTFNMEDLYEELWTKTKLTFKYIVERYKNQYDWVYKVDDDSYVVVDNLKLYLKSRNYSESTYYGCQFKYKGGYNSGGSGYVMSSHVAELFVSTLQMSTCHSLVGGAEDVNVGKCLKLVGVKAADTRDIHGRYRFLPLDVEYMVDFQSLPKKYDWFYWFVAQQLKKGLECCSDSAIAFHYVTSSNMRMLEYFIYYLHPFTQRS